MQKHMWAGERTCASASHCCLGQTNLCRWTPHALILTGHQTDLLACFGSCSSQASSSCMYGYVFNVRDLFADKQMIEITCRGFGVYASGNQAHSATFASLTKVIFCMLWCSCWLACRTAGRSHTISYQHFI